MPRIPTQERLRNLSIVYSHLLGMVSVGGGTGWMSSITATRMGMTKISPGPTLGPIATMSSVRSIKIVLRPSLSLSNLREMFFRQTIPKVFWERASSPRDLGISLVRLKFLNPRSMARSQGILIGMTWCERPWSPSVASRWDVPGVIITSSILSVRPITISYKPCLPQSIAPTGHLT